MGTSTVDTVIITKDNMPKNVTVLSIDVGIKNLSYCVLSVSNTINVLKWQNIQVTDECVKKISMSSLTEQLLSTLEEYFDDTCFFDHVIIENQPMLKNGQMKTVSVIIYTYFNMLKMHHGNILDVRFVSAINKLKCHTVSHNASIKSTYKDRKKASIELAKAHVEEYCPQLLTWYSQQIKKDDCADSLNQGIAFIKYTLKVGK